LLIGLVTLITGDGDGVASTFALGLLPQPAIGLSNKAVSTRSGKCLVDIDFGAIGFLLYCARCDAGYCDRDGICRSTGVSDAE
jgi:hypothetical protein